MGGVHRPGAVGPVEVGGDLGLQGLGPRHQIAVLGGAPEHPRRGLLQQPNGVAHAQVKALGVDAAEELRAAGGPRPAVVVGDAGERRERVGDALGQVLGSREDVYLPVVRRGGVIQELII